MNKYHSQILPIARNHIDTDLIIPAEFLRSTEKKGYGQHLFARLRRMEEDFPLNQEKYKGAKIMVAGSNFGCGSSREHAAWALADWGIAAIIAPSFADIFLQNAYNNGILPIILAEEIVRKIFHEEASQYPYKLSIDVEKQEIQTHSQERVFFSLDPYRKECWLKGLDDLGYLLSKRKLIDEFEQRRLHRPFIDTHVVFPHINKESSS